MKAGSDIGRGIADALGTALEASLQAQEQISTSRTRIREAGRFLASAIHRRAEGAACVVIDTVPEGAGIVDAGVERRVRLAIINADMPFLVDSIGGCLGQAGLAIHVLLHPVLPVRRDASGVVTAIGEGRDARRESVIYIEIERVDARGRRALEAALARTLEQVRAAVGDWKAMIAALEADRDLLTGEEAALYDWFLAGNLTQLGHETRKRDLQPQSPLGICRMADEPLLDAAVLKAAFAAFDAGARAPLILKSNRLARVHRPVQVDLFVTPLRKGGKVTALSIHAGLWTSAALSCLPGEVPLLREGLSALMDRFGYDPAGHAGKALVHALTYLPHDVMLGLASADHDRLALTAMSLGDRPRPQLELAAGALGRHLYAFVWLPRDDMSTMRRQAIADMLSEAAHAPLLGWSIALDESGLALLRFVFDMADGGTLPDAADLDLRLKTMLRGWAPAVEAALACAVDARRAAVLADRYAAGFPTGYREGAGPAEAAVDILRLHPLATAEARGARLYRNDDDAPEHIRLKLYSQGAISLSEAVPALENFGFRVLEELSTPVGKAGQLGHVQKFVLATDTPAMAAATLEQADRIEGAIAAVLEGRSENDRFNDLLISSGLDVDGVELLRALFRYLRQTGSAYGLATVADALRRVPHIARALIALFRALHDPAQAAKGAKTAAALDRSIEEALTAVSNIDDDRILRLYRAVIHAILRTNAFAPAGRTALAFKIDSGAVPGLPAPVPWREIWVYSPRVEGIHLRAGPIARGGLRWSDRRDDFRTEILGLMKAQRVKNAVIVPTGAKGGFYPKQLPDPSVDRAGWLAEGTESYRIFIRTLLSVTDNVVRGKVRHPRHVVVRDSADPYFVVAADKGTATFSDIANAIAIEHDFWLGDAFASGGSNGYDHKAMGITARGGWISVQRHFLEMGIDVQTQPVSVVGVGDMSGDVFGNGMLLSKAIRLVAAFDHRHIFLDPDPDPVRSHAERERLFKLPRSSWDDYDKALISKGGGVFPRSLKSIPLTPRVRALIGTDVTAMEPAELISALLRAPVDLLWFGGIGTYIKAAAQANADAGDSANDRVRVDAEAIRARVIGEGANLGVTQAGRIAYALGGGRINTDFIDNSAGVDCSDNEVNIKIALGKAVADGALDPAARNKLLTRMTGSVAALVLEDNRLQALGLSMAQAGGADDLPAFVRLIGAFARHGRLDRRVEGLAGDQELLRRTQDGQGMTRPELAVLLATAKLAFQEAIEQSPLATDPVMQPDLMAAFPAAMQTAHADTILTHQLRGEIVATKLANRLVNRMGVLLPFALVEEDGFTMPEIAGALVEAEALFGLPALWARIDKAAMPEGARIALFRRLATIAKDLIRDLCREADRSVGPGARIAALKPGVETLVKARTPDKAMVDALTAQGVPADLARDIARLDGARDVIGIAAMARRRKAKPADVAAASAMLGSAAGLDWIGAAIHALAPADPWEQLLIAGAARDLEHMRLAFLDRAGTARLESYVRQWLDRHAVAVAQFREHLNLAQMSAPTAAMLSEVTGRARVLLDRG